MISIIVPVFNVEKYLPKCIESLIHQTYKNIEIILVDDGSSDKSGMICDQYAKVDSRIKVIHKINEGQSIARNKGLSIAKGEFIAFVDSDDWVNDRYCEILLSLISNSDLAICSYKKTTKKNQTTLQLKSSYDIISLNKNHLWKEIFGKLNNAVWNKLYKRELLKKISFQPGIYHGEDLLFNLKYIKNCKNANMTTSKLYYYNTRTNSITKSPFSEKKKFELISKDIALNYIKENCPYLLLTAQKYCFRARLNLLRGIILANVEEAQDTLIKECESYLKNNYEKIKYNLSSKDKIEYLIFKNYKFLYKILLRTVL